MENLLNNYWYQFIKDLVTTILTIWGLIVATRGVSTWKIQIRGSKEFEAGYNLHLSILKLRDAVKYVRNPAIWPSESYKAIQYSKAKYPDKSADEIEKNSHSYVYEMRWEKIKEAYTEAESHLLAVEVLWGSYILDLMKPLNHKINELNIALKQNFQPEFRTKNPTEIFNIMYDGGNDNNFSKDMDAAIKGVSDYVLDKIS